MSHTRKAISVFMAAVGVVVILTGLLIVGYFILIALALSSSGSSK